MTIDRNKLKQMHSLLAQNGYTQDYATFEKAFVGNSNYANRKRVYDLFTQNGADIGKSYEDFMGRIQAKPQQRGSNQPQKPATASQRAMQVPYRPNTQLGKAPKSAPKNASPFVQSLYETDNAQNGPEYPIDYTSPNAVKQVNQRNREVAKQASTTAAKKMGRQASHAQPIMQTNTPADTYIGKTEGQLMDEMNQSANTLVGSEMGDYLDKVIGDEFKAAHARGLAVLSANSGVHGTGGADWWIGERAYQNQMDQDKQLQEITGNIQKNIESIFSDPKVKQRVLSDAQRLGVSPEAYIESSLAPALIEKAGEQFNKTQLNRMMAKGASDYIASGILNSLTGTLLTGLTSTKSQRQMQQQADAMTEEGLNPNYKPGTWAKAAKGAVAFAADAPWYNLSGIGAGALTGKVFGNAAQQMARMANQSLRQRVFEGVARGIVHGGATGFQYGAINGAVQNYSTGEDTSLWGTLKAAAKGGLEEGVSFATMEGMGGAVGAFGHGIGLKGTEKTWKQRVNKMGQKLTYEGIKTGMEGIGMATGGVASSYANHVLTGDDWHGFSTEGTLESCASAVIFKLTHAKDLFKKETDRNGKPFSFTSNIVQKTARFFLSGEAKSAPHVFSDEEKHQLFAAGSELGMKPMENIVSWAKQAKKYRAEDIEKSEDGSDLLNNYQQIMQDPNVSWDAKAKFTTMVMGTMPESRPMMDHISYGTEEGTDGDNRIHTYKTVNEYAADGTLLSKRRFDTKDKRESIIYEIGVRKEELRSKNALALLVGLDKNNYDLQNAFFKENAKDWEQVQGIVEGMQTGGSKIDHQFTEYVLNSERGSFLPIVDAVASKNGMDREGMLKAFDKDPMKRTDAEQNACVQLRKAIEMEVFPANKVHEEQSAMDGKDVATDNNLGTEQPNGEAVKAELNGLKQAEDEMDALIRDNDVFGQNFQKLKQQGLTNPQIYDWMVQQGGLTVEQLEPFAHYINANARVQGMQEATKNAIDQHVSSYVQDWSFHGTLNGQEMNGEQAIFVQDRDGRMLILGSGEIAFDSTTGRAKEGVGDMIVCLDPNTNEMIYLKSDDVTLSQTQDAENFGNEYRQKLQMINSQPYNEAAQKQAMIDAAKPQQENGKATDTTSMENDAALSQPEGNVKGAENDSTEQVNPELYKVANSLQGKVGKSLAKEEADNLVSEMENRAEPARELELTPENWTAEFGEDGKVITPLGEVKMGENQYFKLAKEGRNGKLGLIKPTLENPDVIIEDASQAKEGQVTERHSSYLFVKAFTGKDGNRVYYFTSVTVSRDGKEVVVSNQERRAKRIATVMESGKILYLKGNQSASVAQNEKPVSLGDSNSSTTTGSQGALHGINSPDLHGKDTNNSSNGNGSEATLTFENGEKVPVDANGEPDFLKMTPEQGAEVYKMLFEEDAEKQIDGDINTLEKDLKKVQNAKYDGASVMERAEARKKAKEAIAIAEAQVEKAKAIKKAMTAKKVAESVSKPAESAEGANETSSTVAKKFQNAPRMQGNSVSKRLPDGTKLKGHYEIVPAESLTPSHDAMNGYKKTEGFPVDENGRTVNDRDYENDKAAQQVTDQMAQNYSGQAITQVPTVSDEGIVYDGNGRTMAGQKAAKNGTDAEYIEDLLDNAQNYGFTREQIEQSGIEHPRLVMVTDERLPYDTATFSKFNRNEKKTQSNTEQAVAKAKSLTSDEVGAIVAEIEGNGTLDAFFNNSKAINDLVKTLVDKGIIGQNEVSGMMDSPERLSAQGKEYVKNLLLGSIFKPETIRMLGIEPTLKNKAINAIRSVMDNMKLGDFSLRDEIDQAIQLLYEARRGGNKVDTLLRTPDMYGEDAAKRYPSISQMMALALEGKVSDFRDLLDEYNRIAASRNTGEGDVFGDIPTKEELANEFLNFKKWQDYGTRHSENKGSNDVSDTEKPQQETSGGNEPSGEAGSEPERPRVEEPDDLVNKELESRIKVTDEETETPSENGPITRQKILIDGDKEVIKVDEPNDKGEYTGSYYDYDGKKFGDLNEVVEYIDGKAKEEPLPLLPNNEKPDPKFNPIEAAVNEFKKEHPLTEDEITNSDLDDLSKDMALDFLNGEVTDDLHRVIYESIYAKIHDNKVGIEPSEESASPASLKDRKEASKIYSSDPMEGIKSAADGYEKEKASKTEPVKSEVKTADDAAVSASNKKVNDLWKELMNAGKDEASSSFIGLNSRQLEVLPKLVSAMAENAYLRIKRGMHNLEDVVKEMRKEFAPAAKIFKKEDVDAIYEQMMNIRYRDGEQRMSLKDWADYYEKTSPKHQENLVGDSKTAEERKQAEKKFIDVMKLQLSFGRKFNGIVELRKMAERLGLKDIKDTDLQELAETAIVQRTRSIAASEATDNAGKFKRILNLYENQPSLNQRDSERVMKQQYSTPAPYAFLADMYVKGNGKEIKSALEPSAGNGMLTIGLPKDAVHVNDIDAQRLANLRMQGFKNVTSQDGTMPFADKDVDVVVTNPPFGSTTPKEYDGYKISSLEGQMAINALESMKKDGRAAIIIGGKTEYAKNGSLNPKDKAFLGYLYSHYNVEDVINVDGSLYAKQGTSYPTRIILINGRRLNENAFPPVKDKARAEAVKDYDELYKRIEDDILRSERMDSSIGEGGESINTEPDKQGAADTPKEGVRTGERGGSEPDGKRESDVSDASSVSGTHDDLENQRGTEPREDGRLSGGDTGTDRTGTDVARSEGAGNNSNSEGRILESGGNGRSNAQSNADGTSESGSGSGPRRQLQRVDKSVRGLSTEKVTYAPKSENPFTLKAVMPADQQEAVNKNLEKLGDADQFLVDELGYNDKDDLYSHLAAEQVDSVALALQQAKKGNAFIIGDMTGIGKGRQAASLIRYAKKQGQVPVYFTKTAGLMSDVYRDLVDIGSPELRPFVFGSAKEAAITDSDGNVVFALPSKSETKRVLDYIEKNGKLPDEYDYVLTTYSQVSNGVYEFDENGIRKEKKLAKGKSFGAAALSGQKRRDAIEKLMGNAYLILDESHTAGGNSGQGNYFQHIIQKAKNVTFFSATFAKRPDNMPIYALRTAMNEGGMKSSDLIDAVKRGGATLQEIMSQTLTQCGQMIRRERDMTGVTIDWKAIDEPEKVQEQREQYDSIIGLFNDIINFQKKYVSSYVDERNDELAAIQSTIGIKKGTAAMGIKNQPFASKAFNTVQQVLLSLKAKSAAERAIDYLKQGMKPVIALNNTNESQTGNFALGEEMDAPDLGTSLKKGLEGTLRYTQKDAKDNSESGYIKLSDLGEEATEAYHELEKKIVQTSTGLSLSPIDVIKNELEKAGYKVGELTGRQTEFIYNDNGTVTKVKRADTDKKKLAREFNDGQIDALILNKSAATGISLHASSKYKDQRKRVMIVAQQQLDVNDEVQMRGRIDRTGQVARGAYEYVVSLIPAEQRLLMMFKAKLKSLDANTTSSQKSKFNEMDVADITNKYGDRVVRGYMAEHLDLYSRMADPFGWENSYGEDLSRIDPQSLVASGRSVGDGEAGADASKLLGRMALLRVSEQEKMLQEIGELYANEIQRLNEMGENDLEITELPLKAKTIHKEVWKQGAEPGGDNAFADNTYIEKVNMAILKKPMKASEVKASQEGLTGGKTWEEYKAEKKAAVREYFDQKIADETQKYEERAVKAATKAKEKYIKDGKKGQEKSGMTDEQIVKNAGFQYDTFYRQEKDKLNDVIKNLNAKAEMFERVLDTFDTNQTFVLPTDMNNPNELSGFGNSYGRLIDIKITDNYSPNASSVSFATLDGRRKITFPIAGKVGSGENKVDIIGSIDRMTKQAAGMGDNHIKVLNQNLNNWDRLTSNESRKDGYIVTGNLMQALVDSKDQGLGGQLVKYTTDTGEVKTGILMPDRFDPNGLTTDAPINSVAEKFELSSWHGGIDEVTSSDGEVKVKRIDNNRGNFYELRVPKSKAKGGKYFLDNDLLKLVNGNNFETRGNNMLAEFKPEQLKPVLDRLSKMGVKVQEERKTSEEEGTHFREEDPQEIELPKDEYAVLAHTIDSSHKNYKRGKVNYEYTADNFYVFKYNKYNDYNVYQKIPIDGNEELINYIKNGINKETIRNPRDIDSALEAGWDGRNGHYWDSTSNQEGRGGSVRPGEVSSLRSRNGRPSDERMGEELSDSPSSAVNNHIERIAKKTGAKVQMVSSVDEITNKAAKAAIEEGRKITGWYDEKTGEVHLYMPNIHDRYTAEKTIWHETVGHKAMRGLIGDENYSSFLRDIYYNLDKPEYADLKKLVDEELRYNPFGYENAVEEGIARLAEEGKGEYGFWNNIRNKVTDFLHEIGYRVAPNTKDVKYLLWLSKNLQKNPNDPYWKMRAEAVKYRLSHEDIQSVASHDGVFYENDGKARSLTDLPKAEYQEATDGEIHFRTTPTAATALDRYHRSLDAHGYMATESYMDNMLSLKKLMNAIEPDKKIEDIASSENPYILQNTMQGAMSDAAKLFEINIMKPLEKSMAGILDAFDGKNSDEKIRNCNLYMITKHGLERNRVFFVRDTVNRLRMDESTKKDADYIETQWNNEKARLDNELANGTITLDKYYEQLDEFIRQEVDNDYKAEEHDYSGIHGVQEIKDSDPYDDAAAIKSIMDTESKMESNKQGSVKGYWDKIKAATQYSVDCDYRNSIISKELRDHVSNMFNWYVPLRKYDETTAEDTYGYITEKGDPKSFIGSTIMRARGHKYLSETNILAQIGAMGNRAISNGGQNAIKQAFARFARSHSGNNLITETSVWYETDPRTGIVYERYPDIPDDATPDEINQIVSDFNKDMKSKASQGLASKVYRRGSIGYKFQRAENRSQHIVDVMIAGKKHSFVINGNPRAAQALNGLLEHKVGTFGKPFSVISRYMAQTCTSYNPEFVMRNMIRDFEFASTNLLAKEGMAYTKTFEKYYAQVGLIEGIRNTKLSDFKKMTGFGLFSKYRNGTLDTSDKIQRYFKEFMENGGETGWVQVKNTKELTAEYKLHIKTERNKVRKVSKGIFDAIFKNLENVNEVAENLARFATYCASRDAGRSAVRSAYDAKEVSTNFNRHGSGSEIKSFANGEMSGFDNARKQTYRFTSAWFRNTSMFFNAGIQSTNLLIKNFKNNKAGTIGYIMAGPTISGMAMALLNNFLIANEDEKERNGVKDPYGELPDYIRRNNLCIYVGGGDFVTIPLAIEERAFYGLGDLVAGLTFSKNISSQKMPNLTENKDIDKYLNPVMDAVGCISQLVPVADYLGNASFGKHPVQETIKAIMPSATSPFLEWFYNSDWKGAPIHRENKFDEYQPSWMLAYQGTPEWLINMNKKVNAMTNDVAPGNENMLGNGFLDSVTDPSGLQHFYSGYLGGAATFMERLGGIVKNGKDTETKDIPFVRSLFYTPSEKTSLQRTKSKWYNYLDETEKMIANAKRLKSKNVPLDELVKNYGDYYKFKQSKGAEKMNVIETATKEMKNWKKLRDKSNDTESIKFANQNIDNIMMRAVDELDKLN